MFGVHCDWRREQEAGEAGSWAEGEHVSTIIECTYFPSISRIQSVHLGGFDWSQPACDVADYGRHGQHSIAVTGRFSD